MKPVRNKPLNIKPLPGMPNRMIPATPPGVATPNTPSQRKKKNKRIE